MKKIIHLSDIHIGYKDMYLRFREVIQNLAMIKTPAKNYVIVITGDIVDEGSDQNYASAKECLDVLEGRGYKVLIVPGNHDYGSGDFADKKWVKAFKKRFFGNQQIDYPKLDIIDGIAFIGLDSMEEELGFLDRIGGNGELGKKQLKKLDTLLKSKDIEKCEKKVLYLHHHPLDPLPQHELKDAKELYKVLQKYQIDVLLFGHLHHGKKWNGWCDIKRVYDAGTTTMKRGGPGYHRVLDLKLKPQYDYDADFHGEYSYMAKLPLHEALLDLIANR